MVLLKNNGALPLCREEETIFIGEFAERPRYQGGGSSHINASRIESALEMAPENITFYRGYQTEEDRVDAAMMEEAVEAAKKADKVVVFAGLPDAYESEGYDRIHMKLLENQNLLIQELAKVNGNVIVVLHNGSPVEMPWAEDVAAILETYLGGEAVGGAVVQVLYGEVNPSGHLAETFPLRLQDTPSYLTYGGERGIVPYQEGVFVGYRYYDSKEMDVLFPFGHGLSYTEFSFRNLTVDRKEIKAGDTVTVSLEVTNTGSRSGKEVVQLYIAHEKGETIRPVHELKKFEKIALNPGETKKVSFELGAEDFSYYEERIQDWYIEPGEYVIEVGDSSRNLPLREKVSIGNDIPLPIQITLNTPMQEILRLPKGQQLIGGMMAGMTNSEEAEDQIGEAMSREMIEAMMTEIPLRTLVMFSGGQFTYAQANALVEVLNQSLQEL